MTEYMDELICLFRKARPGSPVSFQNEEFKNQLLSSLPFEVMEIVAGYVDLTSAEIAGKFKVSMESKFVIPNCSKNNQMISGECISFVFVINLCDFGIFKACKCCY